ncbi:MAG: D-alanyl-D-alanine carboxypeptidase [Chlamydiia bacterium]|nr:D-alanyl-D-alanine carboxypeptidase [Chlamydiia bacterium]
MRLVSVFFLCAWVAPYALPLQLDVHAGSAILMNAQTGAILYEKHAYAPCYPASTTKIATALFVLDEKKTPLDQLLVATADSLRKKPAEKEGVQYPPHWWDADGTRMWLKVSEALSLDALLHGLMLISGNDAANVIAEGLSGSVPVFVEEMNRYLEGIGCTGTHFLNPHGCHHPEHVTTAYDLALMTQKALTIPKFRDLVSKTSYMKPKTNKQGPSEIKHTNQLLSGGRFHYPKAIGVKTGFHAAAQNAFVAAAEHEGRTLIAVLLGTANRQDRYKDAIRLFETAFAETMETRRFFSREHLFEKEVRGAKTALTAALSKELSLSFYPSEAPVCKAFVHWMNPRLPIRKGQVVGEVQIVNEKGSVLERGDLTAKEEVKGTLLFVLQDAVQRILQMSVE